MRHFLKFLSPERRADAQRKYHDTPVSRDAKKPPPPRLAVGRAPAKAAAKPSAAAPSAAAPSAAKHSAATPHRASAKPRPVPEFGGLIERRKQSRDQSAEAPPAKARSGEREPQSRPVANRTPVTPKSWDTRFDIDANEIKARIEAGALESTGVFLASLDNSAITLADSGLYKVDEAAADETEKPGKPAQRKSFDPYNRS